MVKPLLVRTAAPGALPIDAAMVWEHLRSLAADEGGSPTDLTPEDAAYVDKLIDAAVDRLDGPQGLLNRALITQSWSAKFPCFCVEMKIPLARCITVDSISYLDTAGDTQTLASSAYRVTGLLTDDCRIRPARGTSWPSTLTDDREAVTITFTSGFGYTSGDVPASIRHALMEMVSTAYENRESIVLGAFGPLPGAASRVVQDWTVWPDA